MLKRISFLITILILISAFMISVSADFNFNTFAFISNLQFTKQNFFPDPNSYNSYDVAVLSSDDILKTTTLENGASSTMTFMGYILKLRAFQKDSDDPTSFCEIKIPIKVNIPEGGTIQIPFIVCGNSTQSLTNTFKGSYCSISNQDIPFALSTNLTVSSTITYLDALYTNYLDITLDGFNYSKSQLLIANIVNTRDTDAYCLSFTLRYNRTMSNECIIFPMIYEGDQLIFYYPPNPYNIPILKEINETLNLIISKLVSGDNSVADLLDSVISSLGSIDSNIGSIDLNIIEIVDQLNYLSTINTTNKSINSTLLVIRNMLSDLTENTQNLPSQVFDQIIEDNNEYIDNQKETTVNRYNDANEEKNNIYTFSSSGLTASGGTYDIVADLVADAGSDEAFNGIFGLIFGNSNISGIILTVIAIGTISYILYGKKG